jgi:hypothetical protein
MLHHAATQHALSSSRDNGLLNYLEISKNGLPQKPTLKPTPKPNARAKGKGKAIEDASTGATASASATAGASASSDANIDPSLDTPIDQQNPYERELDEIDSLIQIPSLSMAEFTDLYDDGVPFEQLHRTDTPAAGRDLIGIQRHCLKVETMKALIFIRNRYRGGVK